MSNLPDRYSHTRRRHNPHSHHIDLSSSEGTDFSSKTSLLGITTTNPHLKSSHQSSQYLGDSNKDEENKYTKNLEPTASFPNFTSLIGSVGTNTSINQFWNTAQSSFTNFAQNYTQSLDLITREASPSVNFYQDLPELKFQPNGLPNRDDRNKNLQASIQFNQLAKRIGRDMSLTCAKMEKLTELAKKKSLFDDKSGEMNELSHYIKQVQ